MLHVFVYHTLKQNTLNIHITCHTKVFITSQFTHLSTHSYQQVKNFDSMSFSTLTPYPTHLILELISSLSVVQSSRPRFAQIKSSSSFIVRAIPPNPHLPLHTKGTKGVVVSMSFIYLCYTHPHHQPLSHLIRSIKGIYVQGSYRKSSQSRSCMFQTMRSRSYPFFRFVIKVFLVGKW
ncbi:hypothetical protein BU24DRAFT_97394 [Aaosphaeria arxii CBS 175.79]|uniref:Uncharacterized protein n=1 Tax=Aaosphaeria arxii CBS 175.79 TaxID=1450172 RepID=A0A6A5X6T7_9PLEO|nr:uncharacterized protein BU24DRAFT_97394 [Aaosphaeria arxii CBS 175.79]KAF2008494.1 hypothetical protein BU24DRAFT_97394 [Aaosphaeria arxii CBS 175.79]